tara:strand:+ start:278 stop:730 length:453 start_codon:yes stop_codon:yes gene_type:complete
VDWRFFEENDLDWILKATKDMFDESEWSDGEYDKDKVIRYFYHVIDNPLYMFGIIALKGEKKIGFMTGEIHQFSFMNDIFAKESELYVIPSERGKMGGLFMMKKFIKWAKNNKAREVHFEPSVNGGSVDKYDAFAKKLGMNKEPNYRIKL